MAVHNDLGAKGEAIALEFLQKKGYIILHRNWRYKKTEIDILAQKDKQLIVVEVKTRKSKAFGSPQDFVDQRKIGHLLSATNAYAEINNIDMEIRFDIIAITFDCNPPEIEHLKDAFYYF